MIGNVKLFWIITTCCTDYNNHDNNYAIIVTTCCVDWEARHSSPIWGSGDFTFDLKTIFSLPYLTLFRPFDHCLSLPLNNKQNDSIMLLRMG